ncbi:hypothetical protein [Pseudomonas nabeulensis]|uniref:hypothetical protein n=1 Tax=Pseudomonas nabeulensis TaxID=2293833 RepID=UPI00107616B5|nr:hypothetical protein [Pseudomonas nabeulensis]
MEVLRPARMHFGWRTLSDVLGYVEQTQASGVIGFEHALDHVVYAKLLPKLRGEDSPRFQAVFAALKKVLEARGLTDSHQKVRDMHEDLMHTGSTRFWRRPCRSFIVRVPKAYDLQSCGVRSLRGFPSA